MSHTTCVLFKVLGMDFFILLDSRMMLVTQHGTGLPPRSEGPQGNGARSLATLNFPMAITIGRFASMCAAAGV